MQALITPADAAKRIGVSIHMVKLWMWREEDPLPSVQVGKSGQHRRIVADQIDTWLADEAARKAKVKK